MVDGGKLGRVVGIDEIVKVGRVDTVEEGIQLGRTVGTGEGTALGSNDGNIVGLDDGLRDGLTVGIFEGGLVRDCDGGNVLGTILGSADGSEFTCFTLVERIHTVTMTKIRNVLIILGPIRIMRGLYRIRLETSR